MNNYNPSLYTKVFPNNTRINDLLNLLLSLNNSFDDLQSKLNYGIISPIEAEIILERMKLEKLKIKEELIKHYHVGRNNKPLTIPTTPNYHQNSMFRVKYIDGTYDCSKTYSGLLDKMMIHYNVEMSDYSFAGVWKRAMDVYKLKHPNKDKTILCKETDYKRFIDDSFAKKDIRKITPDYLEEYSLDLIHKNKLCVSAYKSFKGVINLVYEYALRNQHYGIYSNPGKIMDNSEAYEACGYYERIKSVNEIILSEEQADSLINLFKARLNFREFKGYYIPYFAARLQRATGMRPGELFALTWDDIQETDNGHVINITKSQKEHRLKDGKKEQFYEIVHFTKNEKGLTKGGREFPVTNEVREILLELKDALKAANIESDYMICGYDGNFAKKDVYFDAFNSACKKLNFPLTGTYTFRKEMNCKMQRANLNSSERAKLLGHSVMTNEKYYTYAEHKTVSIGRDALNNLAASSLVPPSTTKIISFSEHKKSARTS